MGRHLASSGVDVYTAVGGGIGALYGPLHGGANEAVLRMLARIKTVDNIPAFIAGVKNRKEKLFGFGHRCAPRYPPHSHPAHTISSSSPPPLLIHTMHTRSPPHPPLLSHATHKQTIGAPLKKLGSAVTDRLARSGLA